MKQQNSRLDLKWFYDIYLLYETSRNLLTRCSSLCFINFPSEVHWEPVSKVGSLSPSERLVWFESGTFQFNYNALTHDDQGISW